MGIQVTIDLPAIIDTNEGLFKPTVRFPKTDRRDQELLGGYFVDENGLPVVAKDEDNPKGAFTLGSGSAKMGVYNPFNRRVTVGHPEWIAGRDGTPIYDSFELGEVAHLARQLIRRDWNDVNFGQAGTLANTMAHAVVHLLYSVYLLDPSAIKEQIIDAYGNSIREDGTSPLNNPGASFLETWERLYQKHPAMCRGHIARMVEYLTLPAATEAVSQHERV